MYSIPFSSIFPVTQVQLTEKFLWVLQNADGIHCLTGSKWELSSWARNKYSSPQKGQAFEGNTNRRMEQ